MGNFGDRDADYYNGWNGGNSTSESGREGQRHGEAYRQATQVHQPHSGESKSSGIPPFEWSGGSSGNSGVSARVLFWAGGLVLAVFVFFKVVAFGIVQFEKIQGTPIVVIVEKGLITCLFRKDDTLRHRLTTNREFVSYANRYVATLRKYPDRLEKNDLSYLFLMVPLVEACRLAESSDRALAQASRLWLTNARQLEKFPSKSGLGEWNLLQLDGPTYAKSASNRADVLAIQNARNVVGGLLYVVGRHRGAQAKPRR
jgi:hypothetical protein